MKENGDSTGRRDGWLQAGMAAGRDGCREHSCAHGRASRPPREGRRSLRLKQHRAAPAAVPQCESIERGAQQREEDVAYERARRDVGRHQAVGERCVNRVPERIARGSASHRACDGDLTRWTHRRGNAHTKPHAVSHCEESQERGAKGGFSKQRLRQPHQKTPVWGVEESKQRRQPRAWPDGVRIFKVGDVCEHKHVCTHDVADQRTHKEVLRHRAAKVGFGFLLRSRE